MAKKKLLCILLCALMTAGTLLSCSDGNPSDTPTSDAGAENTAAEETVAEETEAPEPERPKAADTLEKKDFGGRDYRMISTNQDSRHVDILAEEMTGATLNDLVFGRNAAVSEMYNVVMTAEQTDYGSINNMVKADAAAGDMSYDLYLSNYTAHPLGTGGYLYNFYDLPAVDLSQEWWD